MTYPVTRALAAAGAAYGAYCLARPDALAGALDLPPSPTLRRMSYLYGARDVPLGAVTLAAHPSRLAVTTALRVAADIADAAVLAPMVRGSMRGKVLGVTLGWASLNATAYLIEHRRMTN